MGSIEVIAQRSRRASGHLYVFALPLCRVPDMVPVPQVGQRSEGNRLIDVRHAREFGAYWKQNPKWAVPPLLLDTPKNLDLWFEPQWASGALEAGVLRLPQPAFSKLAILDGQHRIFGWNEVLLATRERTRILDRRQAQAALGEAPEIGPLVAREIAELTEVQARLDREQVTVEVLDRVSAAEHKQWFFDIAANAKGITKSLTTAFDSRSAMNRATIRLAETYPLLEGMVERERQRVGVRAAELLSVAQLLSLVEASVLGVEGIVRHTNTRAINDDDSILEVAASALDALFDGFDALRDVVEHNTSAPKLREVSVLGSVTMLRVLVAVYWSAAVSVKNDLFVVNESAADKVTNFYREIASWMEGRLPDQLWESQAFSHRYSRGPRARRQDVRALYNRLRFEWLDSAARRGPTRSAAPTSTPTSRPPASLPSTAGKCASGKWPPYFGRSVIALVDALGPSHEVDTKQLRAAFLADDMTVAEMKATVAHLQSLGLQVVAASPDATSHAEERSPGGGAPPPADPSTGAGPWPHFVSPAVARLVSDLPAGTPVPESLLHPRRRLVQRSPVHPPAPSTTGLRHRPEPSAANGPAPQSGLRPAVGASRGHDDNRRGVASIRDPERRTPAGQSLRRQVGSDRTSHRSLLCR